MIPTGCASLILHSLLIPCLYCFSVQVLSVVHQLRECGFVEVEIDRVAKMKADKVSVSGAEKLKQMKASKLVESAGSSSRDSSVSLKQKVPKGAVNPIEKRSRKELEGADALDRAAAKTSRVGYIEGSANRFYETSKKVKRKKLRA